MTTPFEKRESMSEKKLPPRVRGTLEYSDGGELLCDFCPEQWEQGPFRRAPHGTETEYLSLAEHEALLRSARAEAFEEAANATHGAQGFAELRRLFLTQAKAARGEQ